MKRAPFILATIVVLVFAPRATFPAEQDVISHDLVIKLTKICAQAIEAASGNFTVELSKERCPSAVLEQSIVTSQTGTNVAVQVKNTGKKNDCTFDIKAVCKVGGVNMTLDLARVTPGQQTEVLVERNCTSVFFSNCHEGFDNPQCKGEAKVSAP